MRPTDRVLMMHWALLDTHPCPAGACAVSETIKNPGDNQEADHVEPRNQVLSKRKHFSEGFLKDLEPDWGLGGKNLEGGG